MSLTNWFNCNRIRNTGSGVECNIKYSDFMFTFGYPNLPTNCFYPQPEWCRAYDSSMGSVNICSPDQFNYFQPTWETCAEVSGSQCRFDKTVLDAKYASGTYCPYGNDSKGQVEPTYVIGIFLLLWAVYAMMFFGNSRR